MLATLKRAASELSSAQNKLFKIDENLGVAISGLTADGTLATKSLRAACITHKFTFGSEAEIGSLAGIISDKSQVCAFVQSLEAPHCYLCASAPDVYTEIRFQTFRHWHANCWKR